MNVVAVQKEVESWTSEQQDQLAAYLAVLRLKRTNEHAAELSRRLEDRSSEGWMTLDEMKKKLGRE